jgi:putative SOS response-associated peptidase YedK
MINRYSITANAELVASRFSIEVTNHYQPRYNASPSQLLPVITSSGRQGISWFYWGRPPQFAHNKPLGEKSINQSVETLQEKPTLKKTVLRNRCIIPADGWYAWKKIGKKTQVPHRFVATDQNLFSFAGVWEEFEDEGGEMLHTFMILTLQANETVSTIAERMPVIFNKKMEDVWLDKTASEKELAELLIPYSDSKISAYTVSPRINDPENEHASLILPAPSSDQHGNLTLFD